MLILRDTARYGVKLQQKSRNTTQREGTCVAACTCVHVRSVSEALGF